MDEKQSNELGGWYFEFDIWAFVRVVGDYKRLGDIIDWFEPWVFAKYYKKSNISPNTDIHIDTIYFIKLPGGEKQTWYLEKDYIISSYKEYEERKFNFISPEGKRSLYLPQGIDSLLLEFNASLIDRNDSTILEEKQFKFIFIRKESEMIAPGFKFMEKQQTY
ncbi:MAG: hypothetical protein PHU88_01060 [candidate division Zixibacteria bacterium]|nr:hypothetical protein [candidate division Zixibacteria bacterium]MDD5427411.1 hypothetical protein [candidate division Zixibacteria bacterium]